MKLSAIMRLNISIELRNQLVAITPVPWEECVTYLEIRLIDLMDAQRLVDLNLKPIIKLTWGHFEKWWKLQLLWFGQIATLKMRLLPR